MRRLSDPHASRVVLIGAANYRHLPNLPAVLGNLDGLTEVFTDEGLWGLPGAHCVRVGDPAVPLDVDRALRLAAEGVGPEGTLLVYYAGHGLIETASGALYLAVGETEDESLHATGVPYDWIRHWVRQCRARRRVVVLDCCYAGRALDRMGGTVQVVDEATIDRACVLASVPATRAALAPAGEPYTAFTGELLNLLRAGLPGGPELLSVQDVWRGTRDALQAKRRPLPELRAHNAGDDIALVRNAARPRLSRAGWTVAIEDTAPRSMLLVLADDADLGALAVRLDAPGRQAVESRLPEWADLALDPPVVFDGGPTDRRLALALAVRRADAAAPPGFSALRGLLGTMDLSADPAPARAALAGLRVFCGYYGWAAGQLDREIREGRVRLLAEAGESLIGVGRVAVDEPLT